MATLRTEHLAGLGLLALLPVVAFLVGRSAVVALSVGCVLVIALSIYWLFGPAETAETDAGASGH